MLIIKMLGGFIISVKKVDPCHNDEFIEGNKEIKPSLKLDTNKIIKK